MLANIYGQLRCSMSEPNKLNHAGNTDKVGSVGLLALFILLQSHKITSKTRFTLGLSTTLLVSLYFITVHGNNVQNVTQLFMY